MARTPGSNTVAYYPLATDYNDKSGNGRNPTATTGVSITTKEGVACTYFNYGKITLSDFFGFSNSDFTYSVWFWLDSRSSHLRVFLSKGTVGTDKMLVIRTNDYATTVNMGFYGDEFDSSTLSISSGWHHLVCTYTKSSKIGKIYVDNTLVGTKTYSNPNVQAGSIYIGANAEAPTTSSWYYRGWQSNIILENKARTATEVQNYYNDTAWQYGLAPKPTILYGSSPIKEMYYGTGVEIWDTQGPAPDGFHVPTSDEWMAVYEAGVALGQRSDSSGDGMRIKLKLPFAGYRYRSSSDVTGQGSVGRYWSSTANPDRNAYNLLFYSSNLDTQVLIARSFGLPVRCFRNSPLTPNSFWITIYASSNGAGIYHNPTEGVISLSSDGQTWITMADKNLGATQVYNDGDTLSQANCGDYYQWGNNYGFSRTGTVTTSSTKVNASSYGPGNYYSSNKFITVSSGSPYDWSSVQNDNLRGGVSQGVKHWVKTIKEVYYGSKKIRPVTASYEFDFRNGVPSGRTSQGGSISGGIASGSYLYNINLSGAKIITLEIYGNVVSGSWYGGIIASVGHFSADNYHVYSQARGETNSGYRGVYIGNSTGELVRTNVQISGNVTLKTVLNCSTGLLTASAYNSSGSLITEGTYTFSQSYIKNVLSTNHIGVGLTTGTRHRVYTAKITIE